MISNQIKTVILLSTLSGIVLYLGYVLGGNFGIIVGMVIAVVINVNTYFFSDKLALAMYKAKPIENEYFDVKEIVQELSEKANIPIPKIYVIDSNNPNAFATGRNPKHASIAFTTAIYTLLNKEELKNVLGHELSHVKNRDILIATIAATIAAAISFTASMARFSLMFGRSDSRDGGDLIQVLFLSILTPIIATIIQLAISRQREFIADSGAARLTNNPASMISALKKISRGVKINPMKNVSEVGASLFIENPFKKSKRSNLFSTHPPLEQRIKNLEKQM